MARKIYARILVDIVRRVTEGFIDDEQGDYRTWEACVDWIFTKRKKKYGVCGLWVRRKRTIGLKEKHYGR